MINEDRHLRKRGRYWHYRRRIPTYLQQVDSRGMHEGTLRCSSVLVARARRNALETADENYWAALLEMAGVAEETPEIATLRRSIEQRYRTACLQAVCRSLDERPLEQIMRDLASGRLDDRNGNAGVDRFRRLYNTSFPGRRTAPPPAKLSEAFEFYCQKVAIGAQISKSEGQRKRWLAARQKSVQNLIHVIGDKIIDLVSREDALCFYAWWTERMKPKLGRKEIGTHSANRDLGAIRAFYRDYYAYFGDDSRENPFRRLAFKKLPGRRAPIFENTWIARQILRPGALDHLNQDARALLYVLIETGCRTSEVANLTERDIILDTDAPYIKIRPSLRREIKTASSIRDIPLVGVALEAMRQYPTGFHRFRDRTEPLSRYLNAGLRDYDLLPTDHHVIYSFRHTFEKRMLEAGLDFEVRCRLMGHATGRPHYGDGGSIAFRRDQLMKIAFPYSRELFA